MLTYISLKIGKLGKIGKHDVIVTSYMGYLYFSVGMETEDLYSYTVVPNKHIPGVYFLSS